MDGVSAFDTVVTAEWAGPVHLFSCNFLILVTLLLSCNS